MKDFYEKCVKLSDVVGKKVVDVVGHISNDFGEPTFQIFAVKFDDGTYESCGGEHDYPYVEYVVPERFIKKDDAEET